MLLSKSNLLVKEVAKDVVHVNQDGSTVATNGRVVLAVSPVLPEMEKAYPPIGDLAEDRELDIPVDTIEKGVRNLPRDKRLILQHVALTRSRNTNSIELTTTDLRHEQRVSGPVSQKGFPEWRALLRSVRGSEVTRVCVNRKDLIQVLEAMESASPDKGDVSPVFLEINSEGHGIILRSPYKSSGQRAVGGLKSYDTKGEWLPMDSWEQRVFRRVAKRKIQKEL